MTTKNHRRHHRLAYSGHVDLSWTDSSGQVKFARGKCLDLSESGLRVDAPQPIPQQTRVFLRAERIRLSGAATVRHLVRHGARYILGLELSEAIPDKALAAAEEPNLSLTR
jgi:hypothetical protein